jgi:hypothetical protein
MVKEGEDVFRKARLWKSAKQKLSSANVFRGGARNEWDVCRESNKWRGSARESQSDKYLFMPLRRGYRITFGKHGRDNNALGRASVLTHMDTETTPRG